MGLSGWDHLRAAFVALHVAVVVAGSIPAPPALDTKSLKKPEFARQLAAWEALAAQLGVGAAQFREGLVTVVKPLRQARALVTELGEPYARCCGVAQGWSMFGTLNRAPGRVEVWLEEGGRFRPLTIPGHPEATWRAATFGSERVRAMLNNYANFNQPEIYALLVDWIAREAARDFPEATRVRAQIVKIEPPEPSELARTGVVPTAEPVRVLYRNLDPSQ